MTIEPTRLTVGLLTLYIQNTPNLHYRALNLAQWESTVPNPLGWFRVVNAAVLQWREEFRRNPEDMKAYLPLEDWGTVALELQAWARNWIEEERERNNG